MEVYVAGLSLYEFWQTPLELAKLSHAQLYAAFYQRLFNVPQSTISKLHIWYLMKELHSGSGLYSLVRTSTTRWKLPQV